MVFGIARLEEGGEAIIGVRHQCHVIRILRSDIDTSDVSFFLFPTRSASRRVWGVVWVKNLHENRMCKFLDVYYRSG